MIEEKFPKLKSREEVMNKALEYLDETRFNFASFVDHFKRWVEHDEEFKKWKQERE